MTGTSNLAESAVKLSATSKHTSFDSMAHGPAMKKNLPELIIWSMVVMGVIYGFLKCHLIMSLFFVMYSSLALLTVLSLTVNSHQ